MYFEHSKGVFPGGTRRPGPNYKLSVVARVVFRVTTCTYRMVAGDEEKCLESVYAYTCLCMRRRNGLDSNYARLTVMINGAEKCRGSEAAACILDIN